MAITYLLLGSNQGDREYFLQEAQTQLCLLVGALVQESSFYETAAWGLEDQPAFLNQVLALKTSLSPAELLKTINQIEQHLGRIRETRWGSRVIDIDILLYGQDVIQTDNLSIPHVELPNRRFALVPLAEIAPAIQHPVLNKTITELLANCPDNLPVTRYLKA